ncbi:MAG: RDD family protein [Planctomycetaceae bacterium]|nr:RDD family protein [Planctomycetaceae bacterium]
MAQPGRQLDTHFEMVTPENIAFQYRVAGPFQRLPAYLFDLMIQGVIIVGGFLLLVLAGSLASMPGGGIGAFLVFFFFVNWFYGGIFETLLNGQTPGKRILRLRVISVDGQPINALQAILRNLLRAVDLLPLYTYQLGLFSAILTERFQRLGDVACGTMVIVEEPQYRYGVARIVEPEVLALVAAIPPNFSVSRTLGVALSSYVLRRPSIPWSRRVQIARHVGEPLREQFGLPPTTNVDHLLCAVYQRAFFGETEAAAGTNPFAVAAPHARQAAAGMPAPAAVFVPEPAAAAVVATHLAGTSPASPSEQGP